MKHQEVLNALRNELAVFAAQIEGSTAMGLYDLPQLAEDAICGVLSNIFDWPELKNANAGEAKNFPGIDLADARKRIAVQVTATTTLQKVKDTLDLFLSHGLHSRYDRLIVYALGRKQRSYSQAAVDSTVQGRFDFKTNRDILDYRDVLERAAHVPPKSASAALDALRSYQRGGQRGLAAPDDALPSGNEDTAYAVLNRVREIISTLPPQLTRFGLEASAYQRLESIDPGDDGGLADLDESPEEEAPPQQPRSSQYARLTQDFAAVDSDLDEARILLAVNEVSRFAASLAGPRFLKRDDTLVGVRKRLNNILWPKLKSAWDDGSSLDSFDARIACCFVVTNLALQLRSGTSTDADITASLKFWRQTTAPRLISGYPTYFRLTGFLLSRLQQTRRYDEVLEVCDALKSTVLSANITHLSHESFKLALQISMLYVATLKHGYGNVLYRQTLESFYRRIAEWQPDHFWSTALGLFVIIYRADSAAHWPAICGEFLHNFHLIDLAEVNTARRADTYLRLVQLYHQITGRFGIASYTERLRLVGKFKQQFGEHASLLMQELDLELAAAFTAPGVGAAARFVALETLVRKASGMFGLVEAMLFKLRLLAIFVSRMFDIYNRHDASSNQQSAVLRTISQAKGELSLGIYFAIPVIKLPEDARNTSDLGSRLKSVRHAVTHAALSQYRQVLLPNTSLSPTMKVRAVSDYLDLLSLADTRYPDDRTEPLLQNAVAALQAGAASSRTLHYYLARIFSKHSLRDLPQAALHFRSFWTAANVASKVRFACDYARTLYEHHIYHEEPVGAQDSLNELIDVCAEFVRSGPRAHLIACYYGLALLLRDKTDPQAMLEGVFMDLMASELLRLRNVLTPVDKQRSQLVLDSTVYTTPFADFIKGHADRSHIASALLETLGSPEIYNIIATHLLRHARGVGSPVNFPAIKLLYDVAVGLAHGDEYYLPKYEFNRARVDVVELAMNGGLKSPDDVIVLVTAIQELYRVAPSFIWAYQFLAREVCDFLYAHRDTPLMSGVIDQLSRWPMVKKAYARRTRRPVDAPPPRSNIRFE